RRDKVGKSAGAQFSASDRCGEPGEPHGHAAGEARDGETAHRALQLLARVLLNLREDLDRGGTFEVLLNLRCSRALSAGEVLSGKEYRHGAHHTRSIHV